MAKTKTPMFSLGSQGTLANMLTTQKGSRSSILRRKPTPSDPYSLPQAYQRWLYEDYAYLWRQQSAAIQAQYRSAGVRHHLTGFQYWMKVMLSTLPDIVGWWKLDDFQSPTVPDTSKNQNAGALVGPSYVPGRIAQGTLHDGINDYVQVNHHATLNLGTIASFEAFIWPDPAINARGLIANKGANWGRAGWLLATTTTTKLWFFWSGAVEMSIISTIDIILGAWNHIYFEHDGASQYLWINGVKDAATRVNGQNSDQSYPIYIGYEFTKSWEPFQGIIDNFVIRDRILDENEIIRHSLRRYPP